MSNDCDYITDWSCEKNNHKANATNTKYKELLITSREELNITSNELAKLDEIIWPRVIFSIKSIPFS